MSSISIYCGDGKGKTTACIGQAIRFSGVENFRVLFCQFFKDGTSSEVDVLKNISNIDYLMSDEKFGFIWTLSDTERQNARQCYTDLLQKIIDAKSDYDVIVLDEIISAFNYDVLDRELLLDFLGTLPEGMHIVLSGQDPDERLLEMADYVSEVKKIKHPFDIGKSARKGLEY